MGLLRSSISFWFSFGKVRVGWSERIVLKHICYQVWNRLPVQVGCMRQVLRAGTLGWPRGMGWGGRWEEVSGWGTHVNPWLNHVNLWQKPLQYCKVLEKTLESPLDCKEIQPVHPKGNQSWMFIGRTDAKAETPIFWSPHGKSWLIGKDPDAGRNLGQEEKGMTEEWDGWMASATRWTWVWINYGSWWWTGRPGVLRFTGSQRVRYDWVTELNWIKINEKKSIK